MVFAVARCLSVCLSVRMNVRPSVTLVDCIQMAEDIVNLLSLLSSPIILTSGANTQSQLSRWRGRKIHGGWENYAISTEIAIYLGNGTR